MTTLKEMIWGKEQPRVPAGSPEGGQFASIGARTLLSGAKQNILPLDAAVGIDAGGGYRVEEAVGTMSGGSYVRVSNGEHVIVVGHARPVG